MMAMFQRDDKAVEETAGMQDMGLRRFWVFAFVGWTVFLWISRVRNVLSNEELTTSGRGVRLAVVVIFVGLAIGAFVGLRRSRGEVLIALWGFTIVYWLIRGTGILIDDYSLGFKAIHSVLAVVSIGLATRMRGHQSLRVPPRSSSSAK